MKGADRMNGVTRVLVVDDSAYVRKVVSQMLSATRTSRWSGSRAMGTRRWSWSRSSAPTS